MLAYNALKEFYFQKEGIVFDYFVLYPTPAPNNLFKYSRKLLLTDNEILCWKTWEKLAEGGYTVVVPSLPGCITYGGTIEESITMAKEAIELYIEILKEHNDNAPFL